MTPEQIVDLAYGNISNEECQSVDPEQLEADILEIYFPR